MQRYKVAVTAQLDAPVSAYRLRLLTGGEVHVLAPDMVKVELCLRGGCSRVAASAAVLALRQALPPGTGFARPPAWTARRAGLLGLGRRTSGRWRPGDDDDGLSGVREPRRPLPSTGSASVALGP